MRNPENPLYQRAKKYLMNRTNYETFVSIPYDQMGAALDRVREFLAFIGSPQNEYPIVHVAGVKGKGTVCAALDQIWRQAGYRVGVFASPHIDDLLERFQIDGKPCDKMIFAETTSALVERWKAFKKFKRQEEESKSLGSRAVDALPSQMTFFEWSLVIALTLFARAKVDIAILEVGMGGRFDATNVCYADVSVLTSVSFDHCEQLGDTLMKIAGEKLGIVKSNAPLVCGVGFANYLYSGYDDFQTREKELAEKAEKERRELPAEPTPLPNAADESTDSGASETSENVETPENEGRKFDQGRVDDPREFAFMVDPQKIITRKDVEELRLFAAKVAREHGAPFFSVERISPRVAALPTPPMDSVRKWNFEIALRVVEILARRDAAPEMRPGAGDPQTTKRFPVADDAVRRAAESFYMPARCEIVSTKPLIIVDGAHNRASVAAFLRVVKERYPQRKVRVLFATTVGKDVRGMLAELAARADEIILTERSRSKRAVPLPDLIETHEKLLDETCAEDASVRRKFRVAPDFRAFLTDYCSRHSAERDVMCVVGSFYFASEARKTIRKMG